MAGGLRDRNDRGASSNVSGAGVVVVGGDDGDSIDAPPKKQWPFLWARTDDLVAVNRISRRSESKAVLVRAQAKKCLY